MEPEDKLLGFFLAAPILAIGLWVFATTVPPYSAHISLWFSILALIPIGYGVVEFDNVLSGYPTDSYTSHAASANAPMAFLRATLSEVFPLFGQQMLVGMGNNNALILLVVLATCFCGVAMWFAVHGRRLRQRSPFASKNVLSSNSSRSTLVDEEKVEPTEWI